MKISSQSSLECVVIFVLALGFEPGESAAYRIVKVKAVANILPIRANIEKALNPKTPVSGRRNSHVRQRGLTIIHDLESKIIIQKVFYDI
jgi:hypothetical protein